VQGTGAGAPCWHPPGSHIPPGDHPHPHAYRPLGIASVRPAAIRSLEFWASVSFRQIGEDMRHPQRAIRCAMAIRDAVQTLGIQVGATN